jgi:DMSO reductase anchor subunit
MLLRHVRLLCFLIVKMVVCNALLPALTCRFQSAAHVFSAHTTSAAKRPTVMAASSNAPEPVWFTISHMHNCENASSNRRQHIVKCSQALVFGLSIMLRVHAGEYRSRQAGAPKEEARTSNVSAS